MPTKDVINAQISILERSIEEDQTTVAVQWAKTFISNASNDAATNIAKLVMACISEGDFKTQSDFVEGNKLSSPSNVLTIADYLSHASRVIIDYQALSSENKKEFLAYFPEDGTKGVFSRAATHSVERKDKAVIEHKGGLIGLLGLTPKFIRTPQDFGINIAMGGEGNKNLLGQTIFSNGYSGHIYFHKNLDHHLLMCGLEQNAPLKISDLWGHQKSDPSVQTDKDQFEQSHSLLGASDTYTAAGSLYFSDPVYQVKLLADKNTSPPNKYGAMQTTLTDENWKSIKSFLERLEENIGNKASDKVITQIAAAPKSADKNPKTVVSYMKIDFSAYLNSISLLLEDAKESKKETIKTQQAKLQKELSLKLDVIKSGKSTKEDISQFREIIQQIEKIEHTPKNYIQAIKRLETLFEKQLTIDKNLEQAHLKSCIAEKTKALLDSAAHLNTKMTILEKCLGLDYISKQYGVDNYLAQLKIYIKKLELITKVLKKEGDLTSLNHGEEKKYNEKDEKEYVNSSSSSLLNTKKEEFPNLSDLDKLSDSLSEIEQYFKAAPNFIPENVFKELQKKFDDLTLKSRDVQKQLDDLQKESLDTKEKLAVTLKKINSLCIEAERYQQALTSSEATVQNLYQKAAKEKEEQQRIIDRLTTKILETQETQDKETLALENSLEQIKEQQEIAAQRFKIELQESVNLQELIKTQLKEKTQLLHNQETEIILYREKFEQIKNENLLLLQQQAFINQQSQCTAELLKTQQKELEAFKSNTKVLQQQIIVQNDKSVQAEQEINQLKNKVENNLQQQNQQKNELLDKIRKLTQENEHLKLVESEQAKDLLDKKERLDTLETELTDLKQKNSPSQDNIKPITTKNHIEASVIKKKMLSIAPLFEHLCIITEQAKDLQNRGFSDAASKAFDLVKIISDKEIDIYLKSSLPNAFNEFKENCKKHILSAQPILETHRGWKRIIGNLLAFLGGLVIGYIAATAINYYQTGNFLFFGETRSMAKLNKFRERLDELNDKVTPMLGAAF